MIIKGKLIKIAKKINLIVINFFILFCNDILQMATTDAMDFASEYGDLDVVKYLHSISKFKDCTTDAMDFASRNGHIEVVKYLHSIKKDCTTDAMDFASENGHLDVVKYLHSIKKNCNESG